MTTQSVNAYLHKLRVASAKLTEFLNPGATDFSVFDGLDFVSLPEEMRLLWQQFNGMDFSEEIMLGDTWLDGQHYLFSVL